MVAEVPENPVQPGGVQLGVVDEEEDEEAGEPLVIEQLPAPELRVGCSSHHLGKVGLEEIEVWRQRTRF